MTSLNISEKKIGILGGMFNPPTNAHMQMAIEAINRGFVNEVWFVPSGNDSADPNQIKASVRLEMVKMAVKDFFHEEFPIKVNDIEVATGISIPTYNLMKIFIENKEENEQFYFMMGQDLLENLQQWDNSEELCNEIPFLIFKRNKSELDSNLLPKICFIIETTFIAASSAVIRKRIKRNLNVSFCPFINKFFAFQINFIEKEEEDKFQNTSFSQSSKLPKKLAIQSGKLSQQEQLCNSFSSKYLGVYGLIPTCIINYIKQNNIYSD